MSERGESARLRNLAWPELVAFDVTARCNLRCVHCYNDSGAGEADMPPPAMLETARQITRLRPLNVCLCGGEPLCCPCLTDIIDVLRPGVGKISMVSNGWFIDAEMAKSLAAHGLDAVQISLDGAFAWQHDSLRGVAGSFNRAVNALLHLREAGIDQVFTSFVPNKLNHGTMPEYALLCKELGVDIVRAMPYLPMGRGKTIGQGLALNEQEYFVFCRQLRRLRGAFGASPLIEWSDPLSHIRLMPERAGRGSRSIDMEIRANGDLAVSNYLPVVVGNTRSHTLEEYWKAGYGRIWAEPWLISLAKGVETLCDLERFARLQIEREILVPSSQTKERL